MVAMLFFLDVIENASMVIVIPVITAVSFLLSWWVTVRFVEEPEGPEELEDEPDDSADADEVEADEPETDEAEAESGEAEASETEQSERSDA